MFPQTVRWAERHHRWHKRPPAIQAKLCERDLKARTAWLVPERPHVGMRFGLCLRSCVSGNTPWMFLDRNAAKMYCFTDRQAAKWAKRRLMVPIFDFFTYFEVPSGNKFEILCTDVR